MPVHVVPFVVSRAVIATEPQAERLPPLVLPVPFVSDGNVPDQ